MSHSKFTIADIEKALKYIKDDCRSMYVVIDTDERERLILKSSDKGDDIITITVFDESTSKMPVVTRTTRL